MQVLTNSSETNFIDLSSNICKTSLRPKLLLPFAVLVDVRRSKGDESRYVPYAQVCSHQKFFFHKRGFFFANLLDTQSGDFG